MLLRNGDTTRDPRLDRCVQFDRRSLDYPIRALVEDKPLRGRTWPCATRLDQGNEGSCVGHGWAHELAALPVKVPVSSDLARRIYWNAQKIDPWEGEDYEGTSVLAGAKTVQNMGFMGEYRWAFTIDDIIRTLSAHGPVVFGTVWTDSMFDPHPSGLVDTAGTVMGGHCWLGRGILLTTRLPGEGKTGPLIRAVNSWGTGWGVGGDFYIRVDELETLLQDDGECCVPVTRSR